MQDRRFLCGSAPIVHSQDFLLRAPVGLLPVLIFLVVLVWMDSYKLVTVRAVLLTILAGVMTAIVAWWVNGWLMARVPGDLYFYTRYVSPPVEECLKALVVIGLFRAHRIGFLVDAAIFGFAVGAGFALAENLYNLYRAYDANMAVWVVRGFGTALMHGGVCSIFAVISQSMTERNMKVNPARYLPGLAAAVLLHSFFNHFLLPPVMMAFFFVLVLPPIMVVVFRRSANHLHHWLQLDFDADAKLLRQIGSGEFSSSNIGRFLGDLRDKFPGPVVVDLLCYLRLYTELAMRAKGVLMMRENGLDMPVGERTRDKFIELDYLRRSIGRTGLLAIRPFLHMERKDLWQLKVLAAGVKRAGRDEKPDIEAYSGRQRVD
ncbi:PrsW family intramembrane metalloprotease [Marinihelvus fidelis]|uniref:PrsW family intramembrane metalloprotease n=1 Tax=Marinihelvus fidelis TaxID=2613842 RepID=A0A5N0TGR9_9GAMM|nr:PrsW family glutamic-type intramembrane protease [Marinihelvus fidelis]KAA9133327.1 PrsW family intramembrane metalloprotease [Marinihelvus fidelis]